VGGVVIEGPPLGEKSVLTCKVTLPPVLVRIMYLKAVEPVKFVKPPAPLSVVAAGMVSNPSAPTVTATDVALAPKAAGASARAKRTNNSTSVLIPLLSTLMTEALRIALFSS
jgi:hypothetical protein